MINIKRLTNNDSKYTILRKTCKLTLHQFASTTSFHGAKYTIDRNGNIFTK